MFEAINATGAEQACVGQLSNAGRGHSQRPTGEQLPYKSLTFKMLRWAPRPHRHSAGEQRSDSGQGAADTEHVTPPPCAWRARRQRTPSFVRFPAARARRNRDSFLCPRKNGPVRQHPEINKECYHKRLCVVASTHVVSPPIFHLPDYLSTLLGWWVPPQRRLTLSAIMGPCKREERILVLWQVAIKS